MTVPVRGVMKLPAISFEMVIMAEGQLFDQTRTDEREI